VTEHRPVGLRDNPAGKEIDCLCGFVSDPFPTEDEVWDQYDQHIKEEAAEMATQKRASAKTSASKRAAKTTATVPESIKPEPSETAKATIAKKAPVKKPVARRARPKKPPEETYTKEEWSWEDAEMALGKNVSNRNKRQPDVDKYARSMASTNTDGTPMWNQCMAPIVFDWHGNLINGQHRLFAQVQSQTTQTWYVVRNADPATQKTIDTGLGRTASDELQAEGYTNAVLLASVARWAHLLEQGLTNTGRLKVSNEEILDMVSRHPDLTHSAQMGLYARTGFVTIKPTPMAAAHWWIAQHNDHAEADIFMDRFVKLTNEPDGSAVVALVKRFTRAREEKITIATRVQIAMVVKAWNYDVQRNYVTKINITSRTGEYRLQDVLKREISQTIETPLEDTETSDE